MHVWQQVRAASSHCATTNTYTELENCTETQSTSAISPVSAQQTANPKLPIAATTTSKHCPAQLLLLLLLTHVRDGERLHEGCGI
jgi:hypothetical protein